MLSIGQIILLRSMLIFLLNSFFLTAFAQGCFSFDIESEYRESNAVFLGLVLSSMDVSGDIVSEFQIEKTWKGALEDSVTAILENPTVVKGEEAITGRFSASPLTVGQRYIVLATDTDDAGLIMFSCSYLSIERKATDDDSGCERSPNQWLDALERLSVSQ